MFEHYIFLERESAKSYMVYLSRYSGEVNVFIAEPLEDGCYLVLVGSLVENYGFAVYATLSREELEELKTRYNVPIVYARLTSIPPDIKKLALELCEDGEDKAENRA